MASWTWSEKAKEQERGKCSPTEDGSVAARICINFIPPFIQKPHLFDFVMSVSKRHPIDIYLTSSQYTLSKAFVSFDNERDATICVRELDRKFIDGVKLRVFPAAKIEQNPGGKRRKNRHRKGGWFADKLMEWMMVARDNRDKTKWVECSNLSRNVDEQRILDHIRISGVLEAPPSEIQLFQHPVNDEYPGFARIRCATEQDATRLVEGLHLRELEGRCVWIEWKRQSMDYEFLKSDRGEQRKGPFLEIMGLHHTVDSEEKLLSVLSSFGKVKRALLRRDAKGFLWRTAIVEMQNEMEAAKVWQDLQGQRVGGSPLWIEYRSSKTARGRFELREKMEWREQMRTAALRRLKRFGDPRTLTEIEKDHTLGGGWRRSGKVRSVAADFLLVPKMFKKKGYKNKKRKQRKRKMRTKKIKQF